MGTHYEGANAGDLVVEWFAPLAEIGEDTLGPGKYAITLSSGSVFIVEGTPEALYGMAQNIMLAASGIAEHAARPLTRGDFGTDEDGDYACPRCNTAFDPRAEESLLFLIAAIDAHIDTHRPAHERE